MKNIICLTIIFFTVACKKKTEDLPSYLYPQEKMVEILSDVHFTEAYLQFHNLGYTDSTKGIAYGLYKNIFEKYKVHPDTFQLNFDWYSNHPEQMKIVYEKVLVKLSEDQAKSH